MDIYTKLQERVSDIIPEGFGEETITVSIMEPFEAIGKPEKGDYVILKGKEKMLQAEFKKEKGQAFSSTLGNYRGKLADVLKLKLDDDFKRAVYISTINAVLRYLGYVEKTIHCRDQAPQECSELLVDHILKNYGKVNVLMVGYQPRFAEALTQKFPLKINDLNPENQGEKIGCTVIEGGEKTLKNLEWCQLALVTGSTIVNGSLSDFLINKKVLFYGNTITGAAKVLNLNHFCPLST